MPERQGSGRQLKREISKLLRTQNMDAALDTLYRMPARQAVNPLFSLLLSTDPKVKWPAITALGGVIANLARQDMESARVMMRRLMWQLNDESGGIGWGCPETLGEAMACHEGLAQEYAHVLTSYVMEAGNFLEYEPLQEGALWGIGRVSQVRPHRVRAAVPHLLNFLASRRAAVRGLAVWTLGLLGAGEGSSQIRSLLNDGAQVEIYRDGELRTLTVRELSREALAKIEGKTRSDTV